MQHAGRPRPRHRRKGHVADLIRSMGYVPNKNYSWGGSPPTASQPRVGATPASGTTGDPKNCLYTTRGSILCWVGLFVVLFAITAIVVTVVVLRAPSQVAAPPLASATGGVNADADPCQDYYAHVCHADPEKSAFRALYTRNQANRQAYLEGTDTYQACIADGGISLAAPARLAALDIASPPATTAAATWRAFTQQQWLTGGSFPLTLHVEKAIDRPQFAAVLGIDRTLRRHLADTNPEVARILFPEKLVTPLWEYTHAQGLDDFVGDYYTWTTATSGKDPLIPAPLSQLIGDTLGPLATDDLLIHIPTSDAHRAYYAYIVSLCDKGDAKEGKASEPDSVALCHSTRQALQQATHELQPRLASYHAHVHDGNAAALHSREWYRELQTPSHAVPRTVALRLYEASAEEHDDQEHNDHTDERARQQLERECRSVAAIIHHNAMNEHIATEIYEAPRLKQVEEELLSLTNHVRSSLARLIHGTSWLSASTRDAALSKLEELQIYILAGEDEAARDAQLTASAAAVAATEEIHWLEKLARLRKLHTVANLQRLTRDYGEYRHAYEDFHRILMQTTDVSVVNAWYNPTENTITIPVGILQPPFYHPPPAAEQETPKEERERYWANLASIGMVLGHEMGHALDLHGRYFDHIGSWSREGWWSQSDATKRGGFNDRIECLAEDWGHPCGRSDYGLHTMGEDMADQLGLRAAYRLQEFGHASDAKRFYEVYATLWCAKKTKLQECFQVKTDVHALPRHRVNKSLRQLSTFAATYECKPGDAMVNNGGQCLVY